MKLQLKTTQFLFFDLLMSLWDMSQQTGRSVCDQSIFNCPTNKFSIIHFLCGCFTCVWVQRAAAVS